MLSGVLWHRWLLLERRIRAVIGERLERGASDVLDRRPAALIVEREAIVRAEWWN